MSEKAIYKKEIGRELAKMAREGVQGRLHIIKSLSGTQNWVIIKDARSTKIPRQGFQTKKAAIIFARKLLKAKKAVEVVVHEEDGSIAQTIPA